MDVVPPPSQPVEAAPEVVEAPVADAPPAETNELAISDDIADQIAADATLPPAPEPGAAASGASPEPQMATPPAEDGTPAPAPGGEHSELVESEIQHQEEHTPAPQQPATPKQHNPAATAVIIAVFLMLALAGLAVFAYMSSQK
jgi:hypothetical protein